MSDTNYSDFVDVSALLVEAHAKIRILEAGIDRLRLSAEERESIKRQVADITGPIEATLRRLHY